jgi:hypothetical protein
LHLADAIVNSGREVAVLILARYLRLMLPTSAAGLKDVSD